MRYRLTIEGVVQGVGFRPHVKRLADRLGVGGTVFNTGGGVVVEAEIERPQVAETFFTALREEAPPASRIERFTVEQLTGTTALRSFAIDSSDPSADKFTLVSADLATCAQCLAEIQDSRGRRFRYPFTNCTNCGPRYSITLTVPYDRANTTMRAFEMCAACAAEYRDATDRRFHAEPIACPRCGPQLSMDLAVAIARLATGGIVALKSLGGFQLACNAASAEAIARLRERKHRSRKPFAVMARDLRAVERLCHADNMERRLLTGSTAPIVLLRLRTPSLLPDGVAPGLGEAGVMLPYTPLHHLIFHGSALDYLVMTSANFSEEPIVVSNEEASHRLPALADSIVAHNRDIFMRADDSVARVVADVPRVMRRARGFAPEAIPLAFDAGELLAVGAELKNTFCITKSRYAIVSQHIGDMENAETLAFFEESLRNLSSVYRSRPRAIAHDLHPDYLTTRWALSRAEPTVAVQHHHAHVASCMTENGIDGNVIGVAFDGTGYGTDGQVWGGEFLLCSYRAFERAAHLRYVPLVGRDRAAREPWRMGAAYLFDAMGPDCFSLDLPLWGAPHPGTWKVIETLLRRPGLHTSSCGRLFDAIASVCGVSQCNGYEGESAILLEAAAAAGVNDRAYPFRVSDGTFPLSIDLRPMVTMLTQDILAGRPVQEIAHSFHYTVANMVLEVCGKLREHTGVNQVCLSGGTFQNVTLLMRCSTLLQGAGFTVALHSKVPPNDGGISLGQAAIAAAQLREGS